MAYDIYYCILLSRGFLFKTNRNLTMWTQLFSLVNDKSNIGIFQWIYMVGTSEQLIGYLFMKSVWIFATK